ncbi:hypothetical protein [Rhodococcus sp. KRD162]|uniref:hypothetical protein n=1 Tax=Rhodococcus sp. KRD162 TaxID=2729725 RepID=UPI0019D179A6|nr:hypothetical protein [Rhodococcus sp. KRD162]
MIPEPAADSYLRQQGIQNDVIEAATEIWGRRPPRDFDAWFAGNVDRLVAVVAAGQQASAVGTDEYVADTLDALDTVVEPIAQVDPEGLIGIASDGRALDTLMYSPIITAKGEIKKAVDRGLPIGPDVLSAAWETGLRMTQLRAQTQVADVNRVATGLSVTVRPDVGYVRMLNPPSCSRCAVLAGRFYRFSSGFLRHPFCDCRHIASTEDIADDVRTDPMDYFASLDLRMQDKIFTLAGAQAIREGADIGQVVNARRGAHGLATAGRLTRRDVYGQSLFTTTEGVTKRGVAGKLIRRRGRTPETTPRLMPEDIYELSGGDRDEALRLLRLNGYVLNRSGPRSGIGSRTGLVPDLDAIVKPPVPVKPPMVDLDAVADWLAAEDKYKADVKKWLAAEKKYTADVKRWLAAEKKFNASRILSSTTRDLVATAKASLPVDRAGWLDTTIKYPTDRNGAKLVPEKLQRHLDSTLSVGRAVRADAITRIAKDTQVKKLLAEEKELVASGGAFTPRRNEILKLVAKREQQIILDTLREIRQIGGVKQPAVVADFRVSSATPGTAEGLASLRRAESIFPADWLRTASAGRLDIGKADRAFYSANYDYIAADATDVKPNYRGGFDSYPDEVMAHELGHRMESKIDGITQLEFALLRSRSTKNGVLEPLSRVYPKDPELADEVGYEDQWKNRYAGKSYADDSTMADPARRPAEVFQVGLQDTFGRSDINGEFDKSSQLQEFVIGVMALL